MQIMLFQDDLKWIGCIVFFGWNCWDLVQSLSYVLMSHLGIFQYGRLGFRGQFWICHDTVFWNTSRWHPQTGWLNRLQKGRAKTRNPETNRKRCWKIGTLKAYCQGVMLLGCNLGDMDQFMSHLCGGALGLETVRFQGVRSLTDWGWEWLEDWVGKWILGGFNEFCLHFDLYQKCSNLCGHSLVIFSSISLQKKRGFPFPMDPWDSKYLPTCTIKGQPFM